jgi:Starch-binding associating with outer membrane/Susd and RagB outer membrane lipoprotein
MKRKIYSILFVFGLISMSSCELNYLENPNEVTESSSDADFLLNTIQLNVANLFDDIEDTGGRLTRMYNQGGSTYEIAYQPTSFNNSWNLSYASILNDVKAVKALAATKSLKRHAAIAKTLEAYTLLALVDSYGDVPYSEALGGSANFAPKADNGATIYAAAIELLKSAKADFGGTATGTPNDFYYANNYTKWIKFVNTLQLKAQLNRKLVDKAGATTAIADLIKENNFIGVGDEFIFKYGVSVSDPATQHPKFAGQATAGGGDYQSTYYMWQLTEAKGFDDPRAKYYFYRQVNVNTTLASEVQCIGQFKPAHYPEDMVYCLPGTRGYWGRDHLNNEGIPPDGLKRTLYGVYPAGYRFDENKPAAAGAADQATKGAGIEPIMMAANVDFMLAEAALTLGTTGDAKALMTAGITKSLNFVRSWSLTTSEAAKINANETLVQFDAAKVKYLKAVTDAYDAGKTDSEKLNIVAREYWLSLFGNGYEAYNLYRRTGMPSGLQPALLASVGKFPRSWIYPDAYVNRNSNAKQKADFGVKVFWDTNADSFVK